MKIEILPFLLMSVFLALGTVIAKSRHLCSFCWMNKSMNWYRGRQKQNFRRICKLVWIFFSLLWIKHWLLAEGIALQSPAYIQSLGNYYYYYFFFTSWSISLSHPSIGISLCLWSQHQFIHLRTWIWKAEGKFF